MAPDADLQEQLDGLVVHVSATDQGVACHSDEGIMFCFEGDDLPALEDQVNDTLRSYARVFHDRHIEPAFDALRCAGRAGVPFRFATVH